MNRGKNKGKKVKYARFINFHNSLNFFLGSELIRVCSPLLRSSAILPGIHVLYKMVKTFWTGSIVEVVRIYEDTVCPRNSHPINI